MMERVNSTVIYSKSFCKCHSVPQYNNDMIKKKKKAKKKKRQLIDPSPPKKKDF
jgi:hypothetical protein